MTHTNWKVLRTSDPIPGDPPGVREAAGRYSKVHEALMLACADLNKILTDASLNEMVSEAVDEIRESGAIVRDGISAVSQRYSVAAHALMTYADALDAAQTLAGQAEENAQNAQETIDAANAMIGKLLSQVDDLSWTLDDYDNYSGDPDLAPTQNDREAVSHALHLAQSRLADQTMYRKAALATIEEAEELLQQAIARRDAAAEAAAQAIRAQMDSDGQNDTWWDNWGSKVAGLVTSIATGFIDAAKQLWHGIKQLVAALADMVDAVIDLANGKIDAGEFGQRLAHDVEEFFEALSTITGALSTICGTLALVLSFLPAVSAVLKTIAVAANLAHLALEGVVALKDGVLHNDWSGLNRYAADLSLALGTAMVSAFIGGVARNVIQNSRFQIPLPSQVSSLKFGAAAYGRDVALTLLHPFASMNPAASGVMNRLQKLLPPPRDTLAFMTGHLMGQGADALKGPAPKLSEWDRAYIVTNVMFDVDRPAFLSTVACYVPPHEKTLGKPR